MGLLKRLLGDSAPSHEDLEREAAAEISQFTGPAQGPGGQPEMMSQQQWVDDNPTDEEAAS